MGPCYWCKQSTIICPDCLSVYGDMESCGLCKGTGAMCEKRHGPFWQGFVPCPPELEEGIDNWLQYHIRDPWEDGPTIENCLLVARRHSATMHSWPI
jgi:hypothetical protein